MSEQFGLPPVPSSLTHIQQEIVQSNFPENLPIQFQHQHQLISFDSQRSLASSSSSSTSRKTLTLDSQLDILKKEMYNLRQMDLKLLSQLYSLNESIQEFRTIQEQEIISPTSPNSSNSEDIHSEEESNNEDKNNNFCLDKKSSDSSQEKDLASSENDFIEDMHKKLEKQIKKMNVAPPLPPVSNRQRQVSSSLHQN